MTSCIAWKSVYDSVTGTCVAYPIIIVGLFTASVILLITLIIIWSIYYRSKKK